ncbi:WD40 repeat protein/serine/threonine protein kinase [Actinoplanes octamycinicus]|uniref:WD40 repeat protein/serine/threonine protein kinase n=1 Tax=Actinoplanes octamycinicus TaxID=135948 RepID=A0A7W7H864_9ACTN|nr:protein kinase [Actinoplanes octamycinicus]MBB4745810.1 WD40 repeat protein/serine/threonine protein kinase [Actinoplanes octamycinicus]GIE63612.1 hypothetical protein Aoc01nite_90140 [Actinoplanes octamycinicus]
MEWSPGEIVDGRYRVIEAVHAGGMGVVHRVRHLGWQVDLAVKTPRPELVRTARGRDNFVTEAGAWVELGLHPHTVSCAYVRTLDDVPRVFTEWVSGGSLAEGVRSGRLYENGAEAALERILDIAIQTAWGLAHAHATGLVHRDVKPANVMLEPDGTAKVTDFGLARATILDEPRPASLPPTTSHGGLTPAYCSPEQAAIAYGDSGVPLTTATDIWSWGLSVLEMFAGRHPTRYGQAAREALDALLDSDSPPRVAIPPAVLTELRRCFADEPADRPAEPAAAFTEIYAELVGRPYPRPRPRAADLISDGLSNHALSLLDLGRTEEAEDLWRRAVGSDPQHLPAVYNFGLHRWRSGRQSGEQLVSELESARASGADPRGAFLLGAVQLERHDDSAGDLLRAAHAADPSDTDAAEALAAWTARTPDTGAVLDRDGEIDAIALSGGGDLVLAGDRQGGLVRWAPGDREVRTLTRLGRPVSAVALDDAGRHSVVLRRGGRIEFWEVAAGKPMPVPWVQVTGIGAVAISGDGRRYAAGHDNGTIHVWQSDLSAACDPLPGHRGRITSLSLNADGSRVLSASLGRDGDGSIRSWDVATGSLRHEVRRPAGALPLDLGATAPDARWAVAAWRDGPLVLWDADLGEVVSEASHRLRHIQHMALAGPEPVLLTAGDSGTPIQVLDPRSGRVLRALGPDLPRPPRPTSAAAVSGDGRTLALGLETGRGRLVVRPTPVPGYRAPWCYARPRPAADVSRAGDEFTELLDRVDRHLTAERWAEAAASLRSARQMPGYLRHPRVRSAWRRLSGHGRRAASIGAWPLWSLDGHGAFTQPPTLAMRADGRIMATGRWTGEIDVWDPFTGDRLHTFDRGEGGMPREIAFARGGTQLIVLTNAGTVRRLRLTDGCKKIFTSELGEITAFALDASGERILLGDDRGGLRLRDLATGVILAERHAGPGSIRTVALSPDGRTAACVSATLSGTVGWDPGRLLTWPLDAGRPSWTQHGRSSEEQLTFGPDGNLLFTVAASMVLCAWEVASGQRRHGLRVHRAAAWYESTAAFSPDVRWGAFPGEDSTLRVFETTTGAVRHTLTVPEEPSVYALGPDGSFAFTASGGGPVRLWDVPSGRCLRTLEGHDALVHRIACSRDGTRVATVDLGSGLRVWELAWEHDIDD